MNLFVTYIYQPFFNLLVAFYVGLEHILGVSPDMGVAVIIFTIAIRIILLPITISSTRTKKERYEIEQAVHQAQVELENNPEKQKQVIKKILKGNRRVVISEAFNFFIQMGIFFILYRIFTTGLQGADIHLLYKFMPDIHLPFNLIFLGRFDLSHPSLTLNLIQSLTIVVVEAMSLINSPFPINRDEVVRYTVVLPIASFIIFMFLPAGKKLFIITTLWFSFIFTFIDFMSRVFSKSMSKIDDLQVEAIQSKISKSAPGVGDNSAKLE